MNRLSTLMESTYSTARICDYDEDPETCVPSLELEPGKPVKLDKPVNPFTIVKPVNKDKTVK